MKKLIAVAVAVIGLSVQAQSLTNVPPVNPPPEDGFFSGLLNIFGTATNFMFIADGIISSGNGGKLGGGGGIALAYNLTQNAAFATRLDYLNKAFYQGSLSTQLQVPLKVGGVTVVPFGGGGVAIPFGGGATDPASVQGIALVGLAVRLSSKFDLLSDVEWWSATKGQQYRIGIGYRF